MRFLYKSDSANAQKENFCGHHLVLSQNIRFFLPPENLTNYIVPNKKKKKE